LYHNHPSGQLQPSSEDLKITKDLKEFAKIIDISILDHIIFTDNGYFSFADQGLMN
jgi:DNA repair protein RadC